MVELVAGVVDYGDAPEIYVSGPARISMLSDSVARFTYYVQRDGIDGVERRAVLHVLRDIDVVARDLIKLTEALPAARAERQNVHRTARCVAGSH